MDTGGSNDYQDRKLKERLLLASLPMASLRYSISSEAQNHSSMGNAWPWLDWHPLLCKKNLEGVGVRSIFENSRVN